MSLKKSFTIIKIVVSLLLTLLLTACGGKGGTDSDDGGNSGSVEEKINIDIPCITTPTSIDISNYITLLSGDIVEKETADAEIIIYHDLDGNKKVCLVTPSAYIIRTKI